MKKSLIWNTEVFFLKAVQSPCLHGHLLVVSKCLLRAQSLQIGTSFSCTLALVYLTVQTLRQTSLVPHFSLAPLVPTSPAVSVGTEEKVNILQDWGFTEDIFPLASRGWITPNQNKSDIKEESVHNIFAPVYGVFCIIKHLTCHRHISLSTDEWIQGSPV